MRLIYFILIAFTFLTKAQNISLFQQFNGRYDFTFVGNTLNPQENTFMSPITVLTTSSANLNLLPTDQIEAAYLYWAGCGTGDFNVTLNGTPITASRSFSNLLVQSGNNYNFFSAFADVTTLVQGTGNGIYTLSDLDVSSFLNLHAQNRTNFAGWAITIIYKNNALPLNQLNVYDGLQVVSVFQNFLDVQLNNLNVLDNQDAKIGFLAWEGDRGINVNETLRVNGNIISNPPLNPANNAFNGTNSVTNSSTLYNMDLDIYPVQNNINIGDTSALIQLTSGQDYVMINSIVTKFNSQLPDATIECTPIIPACDSREININYTVNNFNSTDPLPANTSISFYADGILIGTTTTQAQLEIGESENGSLVLILPSTIANDFVLTSVVDDNGTGTGTIAEINENNNSCIQNIHLRISPQIKPLLPLKGCNLGLTQAEFDFSNYENWVKVNPNDIVSFHLTENEAIANTNPIINTSAYIAPYTPSKIWVRVSNLDDCYTLTSFELLSRNCPPIIYNAFSPNSDGLNEFFFIKGLRNIFINFKLEVYNRWGRLIWTGDNNTPDWDGYAKTGIGNERVPSGTYYYVLYLNDPEYNSPLNGYVYVKY